MSKYFSYITVITVILLILLTTNTITLKVFLVIYAPLSIGMLIVGIIEFKNSLKEKR